MKTDKNAFLLKGNGQNMWLTENSFSCVETISQRRCTTKHLTNRITNEPTKQLTAYDGFMAEKSSSSIFLIQSITG